jgi:hypothetical protein
MDTSHGLQRATFYNINSRDGVRPTNREIRWLKHIERHGPQSSQFLFELTRDTHRCKDTALRDMQKLRASGFLLLPRQQRAIERAEFHPYIYDLTRQARDHLSGLGLGEPTVRPIGHWWHTYTVSAFTSTWDILADRQGREYIPAHRILERSGADLMIPVAGKRLVPDQLFAIRYKDGFRAFMLEVDRATEPLHTGAARKSLKRSVEQYVAVLTDDLHRQHYGLKAGTAVLWVFSNPGRMCAFLDLVRECAERLAGHFLSKTMPERMTWASLEEMHREPWVRGVGEEVVGF